MRRLARNRWYAFALILGALLAGGAALTTPSHGSGPDPVTIGGGVGGSGPGGDPDGPLGPTRRRYSASRPSADGGGTASAFVVEGASGTSVWSWRIQVVLRSLISRYYR